MEETLSPNQQTRKQHMIEFLVKSENPGNNEEAAALTAEWKQCGYDSIRQAYKYNVQRMPGQPKQSAATRLCYDIPRFYDDLDDARAAQDTTWSAVWKAIGSTAVPFGLARFIQERKVLSERACAALAKWAGLDLEEYLEEETRD